MFDIASNFEPVSVDETSHYSECYPWPIAGRTDLLIQLRYGKLGRQHLMGLTRISGLYLTHSNQKAGIFVGSCCIFHQIDSNPLYIAYLPLLNEAVFLVGGPQVGNMATIAITEFGNTNR